VKSHPYKLVKAYTLMHFITCILLSAKLIILSYKTGIIISSYALILCVGVTSSSECHASPPLFVASRAQMGNGRCSWAIGMHQLKQNRLPHFSLFFFYAAFFFFFTGKLSWANISSEWHEKNCVLAFHLNFIIFRRRVCFLVSFWHG